MIEDFMLIAYKFIILSNKSLAIYSLSPSFIPFVKLSFTSLLATDIAVLSSPCVATCITNIPATALLSPNWLTIEFWYS